MNKYETEEDPIVFLEKERDYEPLQRFSIEYFRALNSMSHPRHTEAQQIRALGISRQVSYGHDHSPYLKPEDVINFTERGSRHD